MIVGLDSLAARAAAAAAEHSSLRDRAHVLLADFAANVLDGARSFPAAQWMADGVSGRTALLALRAHAGDRDDLDWVTMTHPGSVVWPVVLALAPHDKALVTGAAAAGYEVTCAVAELLGPGAGARWHLTAVAGHAGAAAAAAVALNLDEAAVAAAIGLGLTVAGGLGVTMAQRTTATGWHRAAAAVAGLHAARAARTGVRPPADLVTAPAGLLAAMGGQPQPAVSDHGALARTSLRLYPTNGLSQAAVQAAVRLRASRHHPPPSAVVRVAGTVSSATRPDGPGTPWWDLRRAVAIALLTGDGWQVSSAEFADQARRSGLLEAIDVQVDEMPRHAATLTSDDVTITVAEPPGYDPIADMALARHKWATLTSADVEAMATGIISCGCDAASLLR
jgi:2-methylcitrate dehydratase PrpD